MPKQLSKWLREEDNNVYLRPTRKAKLYDAKPKQVKKILMTNRQGIVPTACNFWPKKFGFILKAFTLKNNQTNETKSVTMEIFA